MTRTTLILGALIFVLAALGVLIWTDVIDLSKVGSATPTADTPMPNVAPPPSNEGQLVTTMTEVAANGGFALTFTEADAVKWRLAPGNRLERFSLGGADNMMARLSATSPLAMVPPGVSSFSWADQGLSVELPVAFGQRSNGRTVEVGVVARRTQVNPSSAMMIVYATQQAGNSGWKTLNLSAEFQLHKFSYQVPPVAEGYHERPIVVVNADAEGKGRSIELLGVYVKVIDGGS